MPSSVSNFHRRCLLDIQLCTAEEARGEDLAGVISLIGALHVLNDQGEFRIHFEFLYQNHFFLCQKLFALVPHYDTVSLVPYRTMERSTLPSGSVISRPGLFHSGFRLLDSVVLFCGCLIVVFVVVVIFIVQVIVP